MEAYASALTVVIPIYSALIVLELAYARIVGRSTSRTCDTVASISSGLTNCIKDVLGIAVAIVSYPFLVSHMALFELEAGIAVYGLALIAVDLAVHIRHRLNHSLNVLWNCEHVIHHSSEELNLATALRQPILEFLQYFPFFLLPAALVGVPVEVISTILPIWVFLQFWYHTQHIGKLGILEYVFITPSQHRVHHAMNPVYIDKNLGQIFCVWDRLFGTYQEELDEEPPVYGVLKPARTWNPVLINLKYPWSLIKDSWAAPRWRDKLKVWIMPVGWRPAGAERERPAATIEDVYSFEKYETNPAPSMKAFAIVQTICTILLALFLFYNYAHLQRTEILLLGGILLAQIHAYTSIMDGARSAVWVELAVCLVGMGVVATTGDWFGLGEFWHAGAHVVVAYFAATFAASVYLTFSEVARSFDSLEVRGASSAERSA